MTLAYMNISEWSTEKSNQLIIDIRKWKSSIITAKTWLGTTMEQFMCKFQVKLQ